MTTKHYTTVIAGVSTLFLSMGIAGCQPSVATQQKEQNRQERAKSNSHN